MRQADKEKPAEIMLRRQEKNLLSGIHKCFGRYYYFNYFIRQRNRLQMHRHSRRNHRRLLT